jgi:RimJ/RimL family protein N-acetyltransferase
MEYRKAAIEDLSLYFEWVNDEDVIKNSIQKRKIGLEEHKKWFENAIRDPEKLMLVFSVKGIPAGQVRIEKKEQENIIDISIDKNFRNRGYAKTLITQSCIEFTKAKKEVIHAYVNELNTGSCKSFLKADFVYLCQVEINGACFNKYAYRP